MLLLEMDVLTGREWLIQLYFQTLHSIQRFSRTLSKLHLTYSVTYPTVNRANLHYILMCVYYFPSYKRKKIAYTKRLSQNFQFWYFWAIRERILNNFEKLQIIFTKHNNEFSFIKTIHKFALQKIKMVNLPFLHYFRTLIKQNV